MPLEIVGPGVPAGAPIVGATPDRFLYADSGGLMATSDSAQFDGTDAIFTDKVSFEPTEENYLRYSALDSALQIKADDDIDIDAGTDGTGLVYIGANGSQVVEVAEAAVTVDGDMTVSLAFSPLGGIYDINDEAGSDVTASGGITTISATTRVDVDAPLLVNSDVTITTGSITSASGAISLGDENLTTTGNITCNTFNATALDGYEIDGYTVIDTSIASTIKLGKNAAVNATSTGSVFIGDTVLGSASASGDNLFISGDSTVGASLTTAPNLILIGNQGTGGSLTIGDGNVLMGPACGTSLVDGSNCFALGTRAMDANVSGDFVVAIGGSAVRYCLADDFVGIGSFAGAGVNGAGTRNNSGVAIGNNSMQNTLGINWYSTVIGWKGSQNLNQTEGHTSIGAQGFLNATSASYNSGFGYAVGYDLDSGDYNTLGGTFAGRRLATASYCNCYGAYAGCRNTTSYRLIIDYKDRTTAANEVLQSIIHGDMAAASADQNLRLNADVYVRHDLICLGDAIQDSSEIDAVTFDGSGNGTAEGNWTVDGDLYIAHATNQDYRITHRDDHLAIVGQDTNHRCYLEMFTKDGDGTDPVYLIMYGKGTIEDRLDRQRLLIGYNEGTGEVNIKTEANTSADIPIEIRAAENTEQIYVLTDGNVSFSGQIHPLDGVYKISGDANTYLISDETALELNNADGDTWISASGNTVLNSGGTTAAVSCDSSQNVTIPNGDLILTNNIRLNNDIIQDSSGATWISGDGAGNATFAGDAAFDGDIVEISGDTAFTISKQGSIATLEYTGGPVDVTASGVLTLTGARTEIFSSTTEIADFALTESTMLNRFRIGAGHRANKVRVTGNITLDDEDYIVLADTDGGAITATLPAGVEQTVYIIKNVGSSANNVTITPNGAEVTEVGTLADGEAAVIIYDTTEGWVKIN